VACSHAPVRPQPIASKTMIKSDALLPITRSVPTRALALICALCGLVCLPASASAAPKKVAFKFSATNYSVAENVGIFNVTVLRSGNTSPAASIQYSDNGTGTATGGGQDYSLTGGTLNFAAGESKKTFPVTIVDNDTANAPNKTIVFKLANATPAGSQIKTTKATLTIIDNEGPGTLDFSSSAYTVLEGADIATITVNRSGASNLKLSVDYATQTALTNPASPLTDYTSISPAQTLTFNPGELSKTFQVPIVDDSDAEDPENVDLMLSNPKNLTGGAAPQIGPNGPAELTINDDDVSTFNFSAPTYIVDEDAPAGHATITVDRGGATNIPASVNYSTSDGTATAGSDYTAASGTLSFAAGEISKTFDVPVTNDGAAEANETVNLALTSGATTVDTSLLSIVDNDNAKASVQLSKPTYVVNEADGTATVAVTLSHAVDADETVDYATADGSAVAGSDYANTHGTLTFKGNLSNGGAGETAQTIQIPITQDPDPEDPETLTLTLSNELQSAAVLGAPATATVTIADDDPPGAIDFKSLHYDVNEADGQGTVTVERLGGVGGAVSVDYETSDGSATAGADYTATSGTLNWAAGDSADKTFTVPVVWDGSAEGNESINLTLTNPGGGADLGPTTAAIVRIGDDGASGPLALSSNAYRVGEAAGTVTITATRSGGSLGGPVTVNYATSDGTATAGSDYTAARGTLTFGSGQTAKSVTVHVVSDAAHEGDQSFRVALSDSRGGANLGSPTGATVTITDDDAAPAGPGNLPATPAAPDTTPPKLTLAAKRIQRALKTKRLVLSARCNERCMIAAVAKIRIGKTKAVLARAKATRPAGQKATIKLKLSKKALRKMRKAITRGRAKVVLSVRAADPAGNRTAGSRRVTVKR
jgi:hypothetical protein